MKRALHASARILAIDLHPQRYGYAVLETPLELLDWGVKRRYRKQNRPGRYSLCGRLGSLLKMWSPSLVAIKEPPKPHTARIRNLLAGLIAEVGPYRIPVRCVPDEAPRRAFSDSDRLTKHAMASSLLKHFPFLASALPPKRKIWESENYRMSIFVAAALALAISRRLTAHH